MQKIRIAINGFGRIGRNVLKYILESEYASNIEIVAVNDLGEVENLAYLLKYDSVYGALNQEVTIISDNNGVPKMTVGNQSFLVFSQKDPHVLPWRDLRIDIVIESTGFFVTTEASQAHIEAGAKRVIISAPAKDSTVTVTPNISEDRLQGSIITSNASCTTNATNPIVQVLNTTLGIEKAMLSTVHAYTATQSLVDGVADLKDLRRGRAGAQNIIPSSTGAAKAVGQVIPELDGKFDGIAIRVPVISGSLIDLTMVMSRATSIDEVNSLLIEASQEDQWKNILGVTHEPLVSTDILKSEYGSLVALDMTRVVGGDLVKVMAWYDNEWGYTSMLVKHLMSVYSSIIS